MVSREAHIIEKQNQLLLEDANEIKQLEREAKSKIEENSVLIEKIKKKMRKINAPLTDEEEIVSDEVRDMHRRTFEYLNEMKKLKEEYLAFDQWESKEIKPKIK